MLKARPLLCLTEPRKSSVPYRVQWDVLQILWFLANPFVTHGIGEAEWKNNNRLLFACSRYQSSLVVGYQPLVRFTAARTLNYHLKSLLGS
ncbi:MAG: hypothetical protein V3T59_06125 [Desulfobacterales bacterium]